MSRLILLVVGIPLFLLLLAAALLPLLIDQQRLIELAAHTLEEQTGATLTVAGETRLALFPGIGVALSEVSLVLPGDGAATASARSLEIGVRLLPLLSRRIEVEGVTLAGLDARLPMRGPDTSALAQPDTTGMTDAQLDAYYAMRREAMQQPGDTLQPIQLLAAPLALDINALDVSDSRITLLNPDRTSTLIELRHFQASGVNTDGRPMALSALIAVPARDSAPALTLRADGKLSVDLATSRVSLAPMGVALSGITPHPIALDLRGTIDLTDLSADLELQLGSGETHGSGNLRFAAGASPQVEAQLGLNRLDPALLALAGPEAAAQAGEAESTDGGDSPLPLAMIRSLSTGLELTVERAVFQNYVIQDMKLSARAVDGIVNVSSLTGNLFGGALNLTGTFNARRDEATLSTRGRLDGVDIAELLAAAAVDASVSGRASLNWQLSGRGASSKELINTLSGPAALTTEAVILKGIGIQKLLCESVALVNQQGLQASFPGDSALQDLSADILLGGGNAMLSPLRADMREVQLRGSGRFGLLSKEFSASFAARLLPALAELDPACRINERYARLDWPVRCSGRIGSDPAEWCAVDTAAILRDLAAGEAERKLGKEAGKLLDRLFKN